MKKNAGATHGARTGEVGAGETGSLMKRKWSKEFCNESIIVSGVLNTGELVRLLSMVQSRKREGEKCAPIKRSKRIMRDNTSTGGSIYRRGGGGTSMWDGHPKSLKYEEDDRRCVGQVEERGGG